jgi:hypothetical protein
MIVKDMMIVKATTAERFLDNIRNYMVDKAGPISDT